MYKRQVDILSIVKAYDLPIEFSEKILNQAERVAKEVSEADMAGRMDIRDWQTVTIDGEDAKEDVYKRQDLNRSVSEKETMPIF